MYRSFSIPFLIFAIGLLAACSDDDGGNVNSCVPGEVKECPCPGDEPGAQTCTDEGRYDTCDCGEDAADAGNNGLEDMGGGEADAGVDMQTVDMQTETGDPCVSQVPAVDGDCDPVRQDCPQDDAVCEMLLFQGEVQPRCTNDTGDYTIAEGESCAGANQTCQAGLQCINALDECRRLCLMEDGFGCSSGEVCVSLGPDIHVGYCSDTCP